MSRYLLSYDNEKTDLAVDENGLLLAAPCILFHSDGRLGTYSLQESMERFDEAVTKCPQGVRIRHQGLYYQYLGHVAQPSDGGDPYYKAIAFDFGVTGTLIPYYMHITHNGVVNSYQIGSFAALPK